MSAELSVIVPVYNEEANVLPLAQEVARALATQQRVFELLFVDDGSTDGTWSQIVAARDRDPRVRGLRHDRNGGQSAAFWTGLVRATGPIVATLDGDGQNDPADLPALLAALDRADMVCGHRVKRQDGGIRRLSSRAARWARRVALGIDIQDAGCFLRVFRRSALENILPFNGWHRFLPVLVSGAGRSVLELPVNHRPRRAGVSKYGIGNRLWRGLYDLVGVAWMLKRSLRPATFSELTR